MKQIELLTQKLIDKLKVPCPTCEMPGFGVSVISPGLPCQICGMPTASVLKHLLRCDSCLFQEEKYFPNGRESEDPTFCPVCNP